MVRLLSAGITCLSSIIFFGSCRYCFAVFCVETTQFLQMVYGSSFGGLSDGGFLGNGAADRIYAAV